MPNRVGWFVAELRRRRVYHVAVAYAVVAFIVWQVADIAIPALGLPESAVTLILVFTILGFPIALVLAWAYEVRPEGIRPESPIDGETRSGSDGPRLGADSASAPGDAISQVAAPPSPGSAPGSHLADLGPSVAVLPFANLASAPEGDFFSDGVTEEITHALARSKGLKVVARTSAFAFRDRAADIRDVARQLGVSHLLEGSVRRSGRRLRVTVQLIEAEAGTHLWSERYDRELDDVFAIQDEIAAHIAERLAGELSAPVSPERSTTSLAAYDAFLRGRQGHAHLAPEALSTAIERYREAIELDPDFAPAHAALAEALTGQSIGLGIPSRDTMPQAREAADRALALSPGLADAHLARATVALFYEWDFDRARQGIDRAIELKPNSAAAHLWAEFYWTYVRGRYEEAVAATRRAQELDPLDHSVRSRLGTVYFLFGREAQAVEHFRALLAEEPGLAMAYMGLGDALGRLGDLEGAIEACAHAVEGLGGERAPNGPLGVLGVYQGVAGDADGARHVLALLEERAATGDVTTFWNAAVRAALGDMDGAFEQLQKGIEQRDAALLYLNAAPPAIGLREDPRYEDVRRTIGLPRVS